MRRRLSILLCPLCLLSVGQVHAGVSYTDKTAFVAALPGPAGVLDFDGLAGGTILTGTTQNVVGGPGTGIIFPASIPDLLDPPNTLDLVVVTDAGDNPTTSPANSIGAQDPANFDTIVGGTEFDLGLTGGVNAFGLSFITPDSMLDGDIQLLIGSDTASLSVADGESLGLFGGTEFFAYFLGVVSDTAFASAGVRYGPGAEGAFLYNIDDITVAQSTPAAAPVPGTPFLFLSAAGIALVWRRRRSHP